MRAWKVVNAVHELAENVNTSRARALMALRNFTPAELKEALKISQDLQELIESVVVEQAGVWPTQDFNEIQARVAQRRSRGRE